jgi:hypothetical protein
MNEIDYFKIFVLCSSDAVTDGPLICQEKLFNMFLLYSYRR